MPRIHEQNRKIIESHAAILQKSLKRYRDQAELKGRLTQEKQELLRRYLEERKESHPL